MKRFIRFAVCAALCLALLAADLCVVHAADSFYSKAEMLQIKSHIEDDVGESVYAPVQGACTDGKYAYFTIVNGGAKVSKYDLGTWKLVDTKAISNVGHGNDMTYNPDKGYIVIVNNVPYYNLVSLMDPDTLQVIRDVELKLNIYSIAYNQKRKQYIVGISGSYDFAILNDEFKVVKKIKGVKTGYVRQGCDCDDNYIYFVQSNGNNLLVIYDYSGKNVANIPLTSSHEVENIFHVGSDFYTSLFYYGISVHRLGFSSSTAITFTVNYDSGEGYGEMSPTVVHYGSQTPLRKNTFTREGYFFGGWLVRRDSDGKVVGYRAGSSDYEWVSEDKVYHYALYDDEQMVAKTVKFGSVTMTPQWIADRYDIVFDSDGGEGYIPPRTVEYAERDYLPDNAYVKEGYIFDGYTAQRDYDGRIYGYRADSDTLEWLRPEDVDVAYRYLPGEQVERLTYEGKVTFTAQFKYAYTYNKSGTELTSYIGVDEKVHIPTNDGKLDTIAKGAIKDNTTMSELIVPAGVTTVEEQAVVNCSELCRIYFEGEFPASFDAFSVIDAKQPVVYQMIGDQPVWIGFLASPEDVQLLRFQATELNAHYHPKHRSATADNAIK